MNDVFVEAIALLVLGLVTYFVRDVLRVKQIPKVLGTIADVAQIAVASSEQQGGTGTDKLNLAITAVVDTAKRLGVKLSRDEARTYIEAALRAERSLDQRLAADEYGRGFAAAADQAAAFLATDGVDNGGGAAARG